MLPDGKVALITGATIHIDGGLRLNVIPLGSRRELADVPGTWGQELPRPWFVHS